MLVGIGIVCSLYSVLFCSVLGTTERKPFFWKLVAAGLGLLRIF